MSPGRLVRGSLLFGGCVVMARWRPPKSGGYQGSGRRTEPDQPPPGPAGTSERPARSQKRKLPAVATTRLTTAEKRGLDEKAARAGLSTSNYLRRLILDDLGQHAEHRTQLLGSVIQQPDAEVQAQR